MAQISKPIIDKIVDGLATITAIKQTLDYPEDRMAEVIADYPIALVVESGNENDYLSNKENITAFAYQVWIVSKVDNSTVQDEWYKMRDIRDEILQYFSTNFTLGGTVMNVIPAPSVLVAAQDEIASKTVISGYVTLKCEKDISL